MTESSPESPPTSTPQPAAKLRTGLACDKPPFDNNRDSNFFFQSSGHAEALARMTYLAEDRNMGIGLLSGEIGCGKTLTRTVLHRQLSQGSNYVVSLENCLLDFDSMLLEIISQMKGERVMPAAMPDRYTRLSAFKQILMRRVIDQRHHLVIMLDEAQQLNGSALEQLRGLTNIASERQNFISLILIGQPELRTTIRQLHQVDQRVSLRYHLNALSLEETGQYLRHRLSVAGLCGDYPFSIDAERLVFEHSAGVPRSINRLCKLALEHARSLGEATLNSAIIDNVTRDLQSQGGDTRCYGERP
jgi:general secretion pathway protein A